MMKNQYILTEKKFDVLFLIFLGIISLFSTYYFLDNHGTIMIYYDAYVNFETATSLEKSTKIFSDIHDPLEFFQEYNPFILYLSSIYQPSLDPISALMQLRIINLFFTIQLILFFYLIARKMFNPMFSFAVSTMAIFIPVLMAYSGTLESNIFSLAMGFTSLYFSIKPKRIFCVIIATIFILLTASRIDTFLIFVFPYLIGITYYLREKTKLRFSFLLLIIFGGILIPIYLTIQSIGVIYKSELFNNNIFEQVITLLRFENLSVILNSSVEITGEKVIKFDGVQVLDFIYLTVFLFGIIYFVINYRKTLYKIFKLKGHEYGESSTTIIYLTIIFLADLITLTVFKISFSYVDGEFLFSDQILPRYMIGMRLLVLFGFMYGISVLGIHVFQPIYRIFKKQKYQQKTTFTNKTQESFKKNGIFTTDKANINAYLFVGLIVIAFIYPMWITTFHFYNNYDSAIEPYYKATSWLSKNLQNDDIVFLPMERVFWSLDPTLKDSTNIFSDMWIYDNGTSIVVRPQTTDKERSVAGQNLKNFIHDENNKVKYIVFDWVDRYAKQAAGITNKNLKTGSACEIFDSDLTQIKKFGFKAPHLNWGSAIVICGFEK